MSEGEIRCHQCVYSADDLTNAPYLCNYFGLTGRCRTKTVSGKGPDGRRKTWKTVETPEECSRFLTREEAARRVMARAAKKPRVGRRGPADWNKARTLWEAGLSDREIGAVVGRTVSSVSLWRKRNGLKSNVAPGSWNKKRYDWQLARKLYDEGQSTRRIADALGAGIGAVYDWMEQEGLERPSRKGKGEEHEEKKHGAP